MAETKERNGIWRAEFRADGKRIRKSTSIAVGSPRAEHRTSKQLAQQVADNMERVANGQTSYAQAADELRAVAQATGMITKMPTVCEFLTDFQGQASPKTESNRRRAFKSFLTWMDEHSDKKQRPQRKWISRCIPSCVIVFRQSATPYPARTA